MWTAYLETFEDSFQRLDAEGANAIFAGGVGDRGPAHSGQINRDYVVVFRELIYHRSPDLPALAKAVHQHQGFAPATPTVIGLDHTQPSTHTHGSTRCAREIYSHHPIDTSPSNGHPRTRRQ
ncbi:hypothetical protein GCM10023321_13000 [Pseudonocardia eucalypti]|uniref:Uncharacterized protein n=1 Tax=Pseudonocardia eucalypti TaxID=648755 RepID=A0ABP9PMZ6_9PSEU